MMDSIYYLYEYESVHSDLSIVHLLASTSTHASIKIFLAKNIASELLQKVCAYHLISFVSRVLSHKKYEQ